MKKIKKQRHGQALEHGKAHDKEHNWSRRGFLKSLGMAGGTTAMLGGIPLTAMGLNSLAFLNAGVGDRALVVIRLSGGNDGLNTIIPLNQFSQYNNFRPTLAFEQNELFNLSEEYAMPNFMDDLESLWGDGKMKVVHSVGYDEQNLSHFRSMDIWESAISNEMDSSGWMGRTIMEEYPDIILNPPDYPAAIQIGAPGSIAFNNMDLVNLAFSVNDPNELEDIAENGEAFDPSAVNDCYSGDQLSFMRTITNNTYRYAEVIHDVYSEADNAVEYTGQLGQQLAIIARLIKGGLQTKLYMINLGGFDTHAAQANAHQLLLTQIATQTKLFFDDLETVDRAKDVLAMTASEFGRRINENGSFGTDHGAAAPVMLFGEGLNGSGFVGTGPDLTDLDPIGNLKYHTDFRQIYASVLEGWLCLDPTLVDNALGATYNRLNLGLECIDVSTTNPALLPALQSEVRYLPNGDMRLVYSTPHAGTVRVEVYNIMGQPIQTLTSEYQLSGQHSVDFRPQSYLPAGHYIIRLALNGVAVSKKVRVVR